MSETEDNDYEAVRFEEDEPESAPLNPPLQIFDDNEVEMSNNCSICLCSVEESSGDGLFTIDECGHKFHSNCLVEWLRKSRDSSCPLCRSVSAGSEFHPYKYYARKSRFSLISAYSRRKNAVQFVRKIMSKYRKLASKVKTSKDKMDAIFTKNKAILKEYRMVTGKYRGQQWKLMLLKREIADLPIVPLFVTKPR